MVIGQGSEALTGLAHTANLNQDFRKHCSITALMLAARGGGGGGGTYLPNRLWGFYCFYYFLFGLSSFCDL